MAIILKKETKLLELIELFIPKEKNKFNQLGFELNYFLENNNDLFNINKSLQLSLSGKVHNFDENWSKEDINKKMDDLFGW